eukprot:Platyproteum_vivax@DN8403_c0_g1_i1.p1
MYNQPPLGSRGSNSAISPIPKAMVRPKSVPRSSGLVRPKVPFPKAPTTPTKSVAPKLLVAAKQAPRASNLNPIVNPMSAKRPWEESSGQNVTPEKKPQEGKSSSGSNSSSETTSSSETSDSDDHSTSTSEEGSKIAKSAPEKLESTTSKKSASGDATALGFCALCGEQGIFRTFLHNKRLTQPPKNNTMPADAAQLFRCKYCQLPLHPTCFKTLAPPPLK